MSDDAADKTNTGAEESAQVDRPQDSTDADVTAKVEADGGAVQDAPAGDAAKDVPVKLPTAEANSAPADAESPVSPANPEGGKRGWVPIAAAFAAGVVVVAAAAAVTWFGLQDHDRGKQLSARDSAVAAACDFGHQVGTYESKNFDDYVKRVKDRSAGDWLTQFDGASAALKQITQQAQASSSVSEIHCAWESGDSSKASVVMLITQVQSKAITPQPQHLTIGVVASLENKNGKWLVDNFQSPMTNDMQGSAPAAPGADTPPAPGGGQQPGN